MQSPITSCFRRIKSTVFPLLYSLYTTRVGYHLHNKLFTSSATMSKLHSQFTTERIDCNTFFVIRLPILEDNYSYLIVEKSSQQAALVDPADPELILHTLQQQYSEYKLTTILTTHKHWDVSRQFIMNAM